MAPAELEALRSRVAEARERLRSIPTVGAGRLGDPDPKTGERWDRLNTLGHLAEILPFWSAQVQEVLDGAEQVGRGEDGYAQRKQGIEGGARLGEAECRLRIDSGLNQLMGLLAQMKPADLERKVVYRTRAGSEEGTLRTILETLLVGHLEEHVQQLAELS